MVINAKPVKIIQIVLNVIKAGNLKEAFVNQNVMFRTVDIVVKQMFVEYVHRVFILMKNKIVSTKITALKLIVKFVIKQLLQINVLDVNQTMACQIPKDIVLHQRIYVVAATFVLCVLVKIDVLCVWIKIKVL